MTTLIRSILAVCCILLGQTAAGEDYREGYHLLGESFPANPMASFAEHLYQEGDYYRAITEYKRVLHFVAADSLREYATLRIGQSLFLADKHILVMEWFSDLTPKYNNDLEYRLIYARSLYALGRHESVIAALDTITTVEADPILLSQSRYYTGMSHVRLERPEAAVTSFEEVGQESPFYDRALHNIDLIGEYSDYPTRDPVLAGVLGIVPGLGYVYSGHPYTGLASMALNGLLAWATIDAFEDGDTAEGITFSIFASGFYLGNIFGSYKSAERFNEYQSRGFQERFDEVR